MRPKTASERFSDFGFCELRQVDPDKNRRRYYCLEVQPGLFDISVQRYWGRIGSRPRMISQYFEDPAEAMLCANRIYQQKLRRGYKEAGSVN